jgi:hypothetical protein
MTNLLPSARKASLAESSSSEKDASEEANQILDGVDDNIVHRFSDISIIDQGASSDSVSSIPQSSSHLIQATHIIVLIHGWMGNPAEMGYIRESIQNSARATSGCASVHHRFVIHSAACNCDKTEDGIAVGGSRLAQEINELVEHVVETARKSDNSNGKTVEDGRNLSQKFTLSIVGNSLGGLYARHALAGINWDIGGSESSAPPAMLIPMVFVTTATPHLGISQHTYFPLPRAAEFFVAQGMKETGRDFFRFTSVLEDLFCKDYFLDPLSSFQQRIAYINVYGTDFQVPTGTAAFWTADSDSPHYRVKHPNEDSIQDADSSSAPDSTAATPTVPKAIVMTLSTPRHSKEAADAEEIVEEKKGEEGDTKEEVAKTEAATDSNKNSKADSEDVFTSWSKRLDQLGWTKVLVDVREDVPNVRDTIASAIDTSSSDGSETKDEDDANDGINSSDNDPDREEATDDKDKTSEVEPKCEKPDAPEEQKNDDTTAEEDGVDAIPDWTSKDSWTAGELLAEFKGNLLTASSTKLSRQSLWDLKPKLPVRYYSSMQASRMPC